ncbi:hypothetical protein A4D02_35230 [Niastella koreensis]|uniref:Uncharacterized protein n=2 Tax=Niastella koreensis TaxID=354356 RepID=G8TBR9_NIAKG|nr:hypothetical protein [Niastella koreensis]AEV98201.1 hypothetical protein Niako_1842 [Niastella koreensis GR20-10]OQP44311.1 hypothetical protein A4D02_35230 [Niastella koreensis]
MTREELFNTPEARAQAEKSKKKARETAATLEPSAEVWAVINGLEYLTEETIEILKQRGQEWHDEWPIGEPHYKSDDEKYQFVIHSNQVAEMYDCGIRKAQEMLAIVRATVGKNEGSFVSVKEFCFVHKEDEEDFRRALRDIQPDFGIDSKNRPKSK